MNLQAFGLFLRDAREQRELSLDDAVKTLKIQRRILEAFEEGDFSAGGSPVQVRGMLRNYARFLRLDEDVVLQHYETALIPPKGSRWRKNATDETQAVKPATLPRRDTLTIPLSGSGRRSGGPRFAWVGRLLTTLFGLSLIGVIIFFVGQILNRTPQPDADPQPTLAAQLVTADPSLATATYTASWTPRPDQPTPTPLFFSGEGEFSVQMAFVQRSWVRVINDGEEAYAGIARPGETQNYSVDTGIEITLANAAALEMTINGQTQAAFGERGQQVLILVNSTGIQVIQPGATPTIDPNRVISPDIFTITETPDPTLLATATPSETPTSAFTATISDTTPIGADLIPTDVLPTAAEAANAVPTLTPFDIAANASATPDAARLGLTAVPTLTPFAFMLDATNTLQAATAAQAPVSSTTTSSTVTNLSTSAATNTLPPTQGSTAAQGASTQTPRPSATATRTPTPTVTGTPDIRPTAIVPLRITQAGLPTQKTP